MHRVNTRCPLVLVVADPLPAPLLKELVDAYEEANVHKLSALQARLDARPGAAAGPGRALRADPQAPAYSSEGGWPALPAPAHSFRRRAVDGAVDGAPGRGLREGKALTSTRQLARPAGWARRTHQKLLLWALPGYRTAAFLDVDLLVTRNIDALLHVAGFAAVSALPYQTAQFNSGVFVFAPDLDEAAALLDLSRRAVFRLPKGGAAPSSANAADGAASDGGGWVKIAPAGERFALSDQSILNHHFRGKWHRLPYGYNAGVKMITHGAKMWARVDKAVVHYVGRPKPWEAALGEPRSEVSLLAKRTGTATVLHSWREMCWTGQGRLGEPNGHRSLLSDEVLASAQDATPVNITEVFAQISAQSRQVILAQDGERLSEAERRMQRGRK